MSCKMLKTSLVDDATNVYYLVVVLLIGLENNNNNNKNGENDEWVSDC